MSGKRRKKGAGEAGKPRCEQAYSPACECVKTHEAMVEEAVKKSMRRFVENNKDNIRKSTKEKVASSSYCGGMVDMITLIRSALGKWAVQQLLEELEEWNRAPAVGDRNRVRIQVEPSELGGLSKEDAEELGHQIAKWIDERTADGRKQSKDPMFA